MFRRQVGETITIAVSRKSFPRIFSRMRSKGSRFTLGVWGLECVRSTLRPRRPQPSATVRNRPRDPRMAVPMGSSVEVVIFGGFRRVVAFVSRGRRGTS